MLSIDCDTKAPLCNRSVKAIKLNWRTVLLQKKSDFSLAQGLLAHPLIFILLYWSLPASVVFLNLS